MREEVEPREPRTELPTWPLVPSRVTHKWPTYTAPKKAAKKGKTYAYKVSTRKKYDGRVRKFSRQIFFKMRVEGSLGKVLAKAGNQGWAVNTWRKHSKAEAHIRRYEKEMGKPLKFPFTTKVTLNPI